MRRFLLPLLALVLAAVLAPVVHAQEPPAQQPPAQQPPAQPPPEPVIRAGVSVAGVDVSNQPLSQATGTIDRAFRHQLTARNVSVRVGGRAYRLTTKAARVRFDPALSARRAFRAGTQATEPVDVLPYVRYGKRRVAAFVSRVDRSARVAPRNATVRITLRRMVKRYARTGRELKDKHLTRLIRRALTDPRAPRAVRAKRSRVRAKVRARDLARAYRTVITIDKSSFRLRLFKRLKFAKSYGVAVGQPAYPTPSGLFNISNKAVNPAWTAPNRPWAGAYANETVPGGSAENPLKARWMGIVNGVGIHGTGDPGSIGTRASHGCIRMTVPDVIDLYPRVPVGTPVLIR
jgi:lipoprotein-anchoring transpeptidase ErfK/SrfK